MLLLEPIETKIKRKKRFYVHEMALRTVLANTDLDDTKHQLKIEEITGSDSDKKDRIVIKKSNNIDAVIIQVTTTEKSVFYELPRTKTGEKSDIRSDKNPKKCQNAISGQNQPFLNQKRFLNHCDIVFCYDLPFGEKEEEDDENVKIVKLQEVL